MTFSSTSPSATALRHLEPFTGMAACAAVRGLLASGQPDRHESISRAPPPAGPAVPTAGTSDLANWGECHLRLERVVAVPSDLDDWKRQPILQGLSPRRPLVLASDDPAADLKYPSDALWSPSLAARANLSVAIPISRAARWLGVSDACPALHPSATRQKFSAPASFCI